MYGLTSGCRLLYRRSFGDALARKEIEFRCHQPCISLAYAMTTRSSSSRCSTTSETIDDDFVFDGDAVTTQQSETIVESPPPFLKSKTPEKKHFSFSAYVKAVSESKETPITPVPTVHQNVQEAAPHSFNPDEVILTGRCICVKLDSSTAFTREKQSTSYYDRRGREASVNTMKSVDSIKFHHGDVKLLKVDTSHVNSNREVQIGQSRLRTSNVMQRLSNDPYADVPFEQSGGANLFSGELRPMIVLSYPSADRKSSIRLVPLVGLHLLLLDRKHLCYGPGHSELMLTTRVSDLIKSHANDILVPAYARDKPRAQRGSRLRIPDSYTLNSIVHKQSALRGRQQKHPEYFKL